MVREATLRRRKRESREEVKRGSSIRRKAFASTLSRIRVNGEPPHTWEQYSKHGRMSPTYRRRSSDEEKKLRHLKRTPNFLEADFAMDSMWFLQDKLLLISKPKILIELRGAISTFSKLIE